MSEQGKIAASITGLAVVVFVSFVVVPEIKERRAIRTFNESIQAMADQAEADADALRRKRLAAEAGFTGSPLAPAGSETPRAG